MRCRSITILFCTILFTSCLTSQGILLNGETSKVVITWEPDSRLRESNINFVLDSEISIKRIKGILNDSESISVREIMFVKLIEGKYLIKVHSANNTARYELFGDGTYIHEVSHDRYYKNKEIYIFIQQLIYYEYIKNGIRLE